PETPQTDPGTLQTGMNYLRRWLAISNALESFRASNAWVWGVLAAGLVGLVLALGVTPWCIVLTGACIGSMAGRWGVRRHLKAKRLLVQSEFDHLGIPVPGVWQEHAVQDRLEGLEFELTEAIERSRSLSEFEHFSREREHVRERLRESDALREQLLTDTGLDPQIEDLSLSEFAHRLVAAREASAEYAAGAAILAAEQARVQSLLADINGFLKPYGHAPISDIAGAEAALDNVKERTERFSHAASAIAHAEENIAQIRARLKTQRERLTAMYAQLGIKATDLVASRAQVQQLCDRRAAYQSATELRNKLTHQHALLAARLEGRDALIGGAQEDLTTARETSIAAEGELETLESEIADIVARVNQERNSTRYEDSSAEVARAEDAMLDAFERVIDAAMQDILLDHIEEKHLDGTQPEVFSAATRYFARFTQGQYELILREENGATQFAARDASGRGVGLAELSDGTRIQLLLAARLAFAVGEEHGEALPIWLDEALTTSDRVRFVAIVEALAALSTEGRQVFYLTSNPVEAGLIKSVCRECGSQDVLIHDLARLRQLSVQEVHAVDPDALLTSALPDPNGITSLAYAQALHVVALSAHAKLDETHLYHVLFDDLSGLHQLLQLHIATIGQWRLLSDKGHALLLLSENDAARLNARIEALGTFLKAVQTGRGKPVDERLLKESGAVTDIFLPRLAEMASDHGGDARALLESIEQKDERAKGFRQVQLEMLRDFLEVRGYLDDRSPLSAPEVSVAVLTAAPIRRAMQTKTLTRDELLHAIDVWSQPIRFPLTTGTAADDN
ncbi:MAG: hypothetical protein O3C57_07705, partial [Verrucomicrobia bacterium]|nr:hypothetical protein [Verrucomicrobiota bacterium]